MNPGRVIQAFLLFLLLYASLYLLVLVLNAHALLGILLSSFFGLQEAGGALYCGEVGWKVAPECTGIFALSLWLAIAVTWGLPTHYKFLGAIIACCSDVLRVLLSVYLGCALQTPLPHVVLWFLPPTIILILWRYFYSRRSPVV